MELRRSSRRSVRILENGVINMTQAAKGFGIERGREVAQMAGNTRQLMKVIA